MIIGQAVPIGVQVAKLDSAGGRRRAGRRWPS